MLSVLVPFSSDWLRSSKTFSSCKEEMRRGFGAKWEKSAVSSLIFFQEAIHHLINCRELKMLDILILFLLNSFSMLNKSA